MSTPLDIIYPILQPGEDVDTSPRDKLPPLLMRRLTQAERVNNRADWEALADLCGTTAYQYFKEHEFDPDDETFKAICDLARSAYLSAAALMPEGRTPREF